MRELSLQELRLTSGGIDHSEYSTQELVPISATMGHTIGVFISGTYSQKYNTSVTDLSHTINYCRKMLKSFQMLIPSPYLKTRAAIVCFYFGCSVYAAISAAQKAAAKADDTEL